MAMSFTLVFFQCFLKLSIAIVSVKNSLTVPPTVTLGEFTGQNWRNITTSDKMLFYSDTGDDFDLDCIAPYPVTWNFSGIINPPEIVKIYPPERNLLDGMYTIKISIFYLEAREFPELMSSVDIICQKEDDPSIYTNYASIFVKGTNNKPLLGAAKTSVYDSKLIPCYTLEPLLPTRLYQSMSKRDEALMDDVIFVPTQGFYSKRIFQGNYVCRQDRDFVRIKAFNSDSDSFRFFPDSSSLQVFADEVITLKCQSKSGQVQFRLERSPEKQVTLKYLQLTPYKKEVVIFTNSSIPIGSAESIEGKVICLEEGKNKRLSPIKEWNYEFVAIPKLFLDNFEGEVDCLSDFTPSTLQTLRCKHTIDCRFMKRCLKNSSDCNFINQMQFKSTGDKTCYIEGNKNCSSVPYSHLNGISQCTVLNGMVRTWEYFVSLNFLKYYNWREAPINELVRMDETPSILYANDSTQFYCTAVSYLFANSISFELETKNGSREILKDNNDTIKIQNPGRKDPRKIDEFNIIGVLDIYLPIDAVGIFCHAPWWNSTETLIAERKFETRYLLQPTIRSLQKPKESFYTGHVNQRLICHAGGEPQPTYNWFFKEKENGLFRNALEQFPELKTSIGSNGEGYLEFPEADKKYSGIFKCVAENKVDTVEKMFRLNVSDEPISNKTIIYVAIVFVILFVLGLVVTALFIYMRRYKEAAALVRTLTDNEIDEFFHGRPELLGNSYDDKVVEVIDFLPYKSEYEIPLTDIEFDQSEKNFLGSGEFSYVVRGKIISKSLPVAIKISKPQADVTLFKSLLSEVKIMIYIGEHENVVKLIGVCTDSIRNRSIHIATEICGMGSLDKYLLKARPTFIDLMDANQEIDTSLLPEGAREPSTLDLINFSGQIARGMEYLAYKSIIHADLASRNVLLTSDKLAKISDFGLSKKLYECNNYVKKTKSPLPWRWMPPESLNTLTFSTQSDIWGYGSTLYEIFTLGDIPFPNEEWNKEFMTRLATGMTMGRPKYCTPEIYSKIIVCWENEPDHRPSFTTLRTTFEQMFVKYGGKLPSSVHQPVPAGLEGDEGKNQPFYANLPDEAKGEAEWGHFKTAPLYMNDAVVQDGASESKPMYNNVVE